MTRALVAGILPRVKESVAPVPCEDWRPDTFEPPFVWVRPPSTTRGPNAVWRSGLVTVDIWHFSWEEAEEVVRALAWLDGWQEGGVVYWLESDSRTDEPDAKHAVLTFSAGHFKGVA